MRAGARHGIANEFATDRQPWLPGIVLRRYIIRSHARAVNAKVPCPPADGTLCGNLFAFFFFPPLPYPAYRADSKETTSDKLSTKKQRNAFIAFRACCVLSFRDSRLFEAASAAEIDYFTQTGSWHGFSRLKPSKAKQHQLSSNMRACNPPFESYRVCRLYLVL